MSTILPWLFVWGAWLGGDARGADEAESIEELVRLELVRLEEPDPRTRRSAVRRLAELGTPDVWDSILEALEDPEPEVADEAQLRLAAIPPDEAERLFGRDGLRSPDELVRARVAEALGRLSFAPDGVELAKRTRRKPAHVARLIAWSIERLARRGRLAGEPERIGRQLAKTWRMANEPGVRAAAWLALAVVQPDVAQEWVGETLGERDPTLRSAALLVARGLPDEGVGAARARIDDPATRVRATALETLERAGTKDAVAALLERLNREPSRRLALQVLEALQRLSGRKHRTDPRPWRDWIESLPEDWRADRRPAGRVHEDTRERRSRTLERIPILSDRIAILIDLSGSIWRERDDGRTRKEALDVELRRALEELDESTSFALIPYTTEPIPWERRLRPANARTVDAALSWFEELRASGRGNVYDAIQLALEDPDVDTILVLSDGAPTGGHRWNLELMVDLLIEENRFRRVAFDHVLVDASGRRAREWRRLAAASGGRVIEVER